MRGEPGVTEVGLRHDRPFPHYARLVHHVTALFSGVSGSLSFPLHPSPPLPIHPRSGTRGTRVEGNGTRETKGGAGRFPAYDGRSHDGRPRMTSERLTVTDEE